MTTAAELLPPLTPEARPFGPEETLLYYDGPLLFWLPAPGRHLLTLALSPQSDLGMPWPFLVAELTTEAATHLLSQQLTLRQAVREAVSWHLIPNYDAETLQYERLASIPDEWLPGDAMLPA